MPDRREPDPDEGRSEPLPASGPEALSGTVEFPGALQRRLSWLPGSIVLDLYSSVDVLLIVLAAVASKYIYLETLLGHSAPTGPYAAVALLVGVLSYARLRHVGFYDAERIAAGRIWPGALLSSLGLAMLGAIALGYAFKLGEAFSRGWALSWFVLAIVALAVWHLCADRLVRRRLRDGSLGRVLGIVGERDLVRQLRDRLEADGTHRIALSFAFDPAYRDGRLRDRDGLRRFVELAETQRLDDVIMALPVSRQTAIADVAEQLGRLSAQVRLFDSVLSTNGRALGFSRFAGMPLLDLQRSPLGPWSILAKAAFDRIAAGIALLVASPLLAAVAVAIKLDSPGPVLFRQRRAGLDHREFHVLKFRTMVCAEDGPVVRQACRNDDRITTLGKVLRRTSLDELPQLINVIRGEMSLVGPRPHAVAHNAHYGGIVERYANRHRVKPGITGWAQIHGLRGPTEDPALMRRRIEHDLFYIENWSFWLDLRILMQTPAGIVSGANAL